MKDASSDGIPFRDSETVSERAEPRAVKIRVRSVQVEKDDWQIDWQTCTWTMFPPILADSENAENPRDEKTTQGNGPERARGIGDTPGFCRVSIVNANVIARWEEAVIAHGPPTNYTAAMVTIIVR